jgi:hypothetical protein
VSTFEILLETFQWTHPTLTGDIPPPCRAHTATLIDRRIFIFGGGEGPTYYNSLYILDTVSKKFTSVPCGQKPNVTNNTEQNSGGVSLLDSYPIAYSLTYSCNTSRSISRIFPKWSYSFGFQSTSYLLSASRPGKCHPS